MGGSTCLPPYHAPPPPPPPHLQYVQRVRPRPEHVVDAGGSEPPETEGRDEEDELDDEEAKAHRPRQPPPGGLPRDAARGLYAAGAAVDAHHLARPKRRAVFRLEGAPHRVNEHRAVVAGELRVTLRVVHGARRRRIHGVRRQGRRAKVVLLRRVHGPSYSRCRRRNRVRSSWG